MNQTWHAAPTRDAGTTGSRHRRQPSDSLRETIYVARHGTATQMLKERKILEIFKKYGGRRACANPRVQADVDVTLFIVAIEATSRPRRYLSALVRSISNGPNGLQLIANLQ